MYLSGIFKNKVVYNNGEPEAIPSNAGHASDVIQQMQERVRQAVAAATQGDPANVDAVLKAVRAMPKTSAPYTAAACVIVEQDARYLAEWVIYHHLLGVQHIVSSVFCFSFSAHYDTGIRAT